VKKKPRFIQRVNEWNGGSLMETEYQGKMVCPDCVEIARETNEARVN
jgi:hypothetical protein